MRLKFLLILTCLAIAPWTEAQTPPFELSFDQAPASSDDFITVSRGGWPLSITISISDRKLDDVVGFEGEWAAPFADWRILLVTENPDRCPSWLEPPLSEKQIERYWVPGRCTLRVIAPRPRDETWLEVRPGRSKPPESCEARPKVWSFQQIESNKGGNTKVVPLGPCADAQRGYGRHPDLPNLVLLADAGPGVMIDVAFRRLEPRYQRNLAGFFQGTGFAWRGPDRKRKITAQMIAPEHLFSSIVASDTSVSFPPAQSSGTFWTPGQAAAQCSEILSFDGGPRICRERLMNATPSTTLRAFLVESPAPDLILDSDGNGVIDAQDVVAAGHRLYSNEAIFKVREHGGEEHIDVDLDGNGAASGSPFPGSPVELTEPPP